MSDENFLQKLVSLRENTNRQFSVEQLSKRYKGSEKEAKMIKIFQFFDVKSDNKRDGMLTLNSNGPNSRSVTSEFYMYFCENVGSMSQPKFEIDEKRIYEVFKGEISRSELEEAMNVIFEENEKFNELEKEEEKKNIELVKSQNKDIPDEVLNKIDTAEIINGNASIKQVKENEEEMYEYSEPSMGQKFTYRKNGTLYCVVQTNVPENEIPAEHDVNVLQETVYYDENEEFSSSLKSYENGATFSTYFNPEENIIEHEYKFGKNKVDDYGITVNTGLPNETNFEFVKDEDGIIVDIKTSPNSYYKLSDNTKSNLIRLLENESKLGLDFDLVLDGDEVKWKSLELPDLTNAPQKLKEKIEKLTDMGMLAQNILTKRNNCENYALTKTGDNEYTMELHNRRSMDYVGSRQTIKFTPDKTEQIIYFGDTVKVITEDNNGNKTEQIFKSDEYIPEEERKSLKEHGDFDIQKTPFAKKLYKQSPINRISDSEYSQTINGKTYNVTKDNNSITIKRGNEQYTLDMTGTHKNLIDTAFNANPQALFRIAKKGITLKFTAPPTGGAGEYIPEEKIIYIDPEASGEEFLQRRIAHEAGHTLYILGDTVNKKFEDNFQRESSENSDKIQQGDGHYFSNMYEYVADAYCLLVTGHSNSEYSIYNAAPKSFDDVKDMAEKEGF